MLLHTRTWGAGTHTAVLLHGQLGESRTWHRVGPAIAERGYTVVALDLPGHGLSPRDPYLGINGAVDAITATSPEQPTIAIGHSMGAVFLAAAVDRLDPQRAVYVDTPFVIGTRDRAELTTERTAAKATRTLDWLRRERGWWSEEDRAVEAEAARLFDVPTSVSISVSAANTDFTPDASHRPSLVIHTEPSDYVSPADAEALRARGFEVRSVPGAAHTIWYGRHDAFMAALDGWL